MAEFPFLPIYLYMVSLGAQMPLRNAHGQTRLRSYWNLDFGNGLLTITTLGLLILTCRLLRQHFDRLPRNLGLGSG